MTILRAGLYERVSTEEQALRGYSIKTQIDNLVEYCEKNKIKIVDHYTDEGISGAKPPLKRPALQRLLDDVEAGKIDIIIFTKLDRWFRSVKEYFKVQDILDKHGVQWKTIHEDYDTTTANGRMAITIFLAIAQNEREKTAERIKVVFEHKRKNKEAVFGWKSMPFGYQKENDENGVPRLVKDEKLKDALQDFWDIAVKYENVSKAAKYVNSTYGLNRAKKSWFDVVHNPIYTGQYWDVEDYCEPYVTKEDFLRLQNRNIKKTQSNRTYLFTGLIRCPECGVSLSSNYVRNKKGQEYKSYRCRHKDINTCGYRHNIFELSTEKWLLDNLEGLLQDEIARVEIERTRPKSKPKINVSTLKEQLRRLEVVYMAGNKSDAEYIAEQKELKEKIKQAEAVNAEGAAERDLKPLQAVLSTDFKTIYSGLTDEDKRRFWRGLIKEIHIKGKKIVAVDFL